MKLGNFVQALDFGKKHVVPALQKISVAKSNDASIEFRLPMILYKDEGAIKGVLRIQRRAKTILLIYYECDKAGKRTQLSSTAVFHQEPLTFEDSFWYSLECTIKLNERN